MFYYFRTKKNFERKYQLEQWHKYGGVLIIGYEMFRNLTSTGKKMRKAMQESIKKCLVDPGADLVVCDEGHLLKNEDSALSKAMKLVKTMRRIVLTGTPLQNNLKECKFFKSKIFKFKKSYFLLKIFFIYIFRSLYGTVCQTQFTWYKKRIFK